VKLGEVRVSVADWEKNRNTDHTPTAQLTAAPVNDIEDRQQAALVLEGSDWSNNRAIRGSTT
jgi:hypothetical protein